MSRLVVTIAAVVISSVLGMSSVARADDKEVPVRVVSVANAPLGLKCKAVAGGGFTSFSTIHNRTHRELLSFSTQWKVYDTDNAMIGSYLTEYTLDSPLAAGDTNVFNQWQGPQMSEPITAVGHLTCRIQSATFTGRKTWTYGQNWPEPLQPDGSGDNP